MKKIKRSSGWCNPPTAPAAQPRPRPSRQSHASTSSKPGQHGSCKAVRWAAGRFMLGNDSQAARGLVRCQLAEARGRMHLAAGRDERYILKITTSSRSPPKPAAAQASLGCPVLPTHPFELGAALQGPPFCRSTSTPEALFANSLASGFCASIV